MGDTTTASFRACILGASLDVGNMGVRALGVSMARLIHSEFPDGDIAFLYGNREGGVRELRVGDGMMRVAVIPCRMSPRANPRNHIFAILFASMIYRWVPIAALRKALARLFPWVGAMARADLVGEIRGGDSFSDIYGVRRFVSGSLPCLSAILLGKRPVLLPQTYGPFRHGISGLLARFILRSAAQVFSRDRESPQVVRDLFGGRETVAVTFCPEVAFTLPASEPLAFDREACAEWKGNRPLIGVNISGLLYMGGYNRSNMFGLGGDYGEMIGDLLAALLGETDTRILIIPHVLDESEENDPAACRAVFERLRGRHAERVRLVDCFCDQSEIKSVIGICDFFIGSRMHACIAALSQRIPSVGIAYSDKFRGVFGSLGLAEMVLDARSMGKNALIAECCRRYAERAKVQAILSEQVPVLQKQIEETMGGMLRACLAQRRV